MAERSRSKKKFEDAFMELYEQYPIEKITIKMVAARAELNRCTFYLHFDDIYGLRDGIVESYEKIIRGKIKNVIRALVKNENIADSLEDILVYRENLRNQKNHFCIPGKSELPEHVKQECKDALAAYLIPEVENQEFVLEYFASAIVNVVILWLRLGCELMTQELGEVLQGLTRDEMGGYFRL